MKPRYKRMLEGMKRNAKKSRRSKLAKGKWFVYMIRCCDESLYTGMTNNTDRRFRMHSEGKGARYTRARRPLELVYKETRLSRTDAMVREYAIKTLPRKKKLTLVEKFQRKRRWVVKV